MPPELPGGRLRAFGRLGDTSLAFVAGPAWGISEAAADALEVSTDHIDARGGLKLVRTAAKSNKFGAQQLASSDLAPLQIAAGKGRLRGSGRALGPDPSLTPPTRTAPHCAERAADAGH